MHRTHRRALAAAIALGAVVAVLPSAGFAQDAPDFSGVKVALVTGGAHPYFQPWKTGGAQAQTDFGIGATTFDESGEWDQTKETAAINALAAQGYNAFGIFGVSPTDINTVFETLKGQGFAVGSIASCPAGDVDKADFCLSTDTQQAAYLAAKGAIEAMGGAGNLVHLTGNAVDSNTQRRMAGVQQAVDETGGAVTRTIRRPSRVPPTVILSLCPTPVPPISKAIEPALTVKLFAMLIVPATPVSPGRMIAPWLLTFPPMLPADRKSTRLNSSHRT